MWVAIVGSRTVGDCPCSTEVHHFPPTEAEREHAKVCPALLWRRLIRHVVARWATKESFEGVVSGAAPGVDSLAKEAADLLGVRCKEYPVQPGPEPFAVRAHRRNQQIVDRADVMVAIFAPGPRSPGTSDSVERALAKGIPVHIYHEGRWLTL